jgi:hypothetical protein
LVIRLQLCVPQAAVLLQVLLTWVRAIGATSVCCLQEELELRASMLHVHHLAVATRSRSMPLPGYGLSSSSASSSKPGSRESSADQAAALARALTVHPTAPAAEHDVAAATVRDQDVPAAVGGVDQQQMQLGSSSDPCRRAVSWGDEPGSSKGGGAGQHITFLHVQDNLTNPATAAAAIAALDARPSALYKAAASALGGCSKTEEVAAAADTAATATAEDAEGLPLSCKPPRATLPFATPSEGSRCLQKQMWSRALGANGLGLTSAAAPAAGSGSGSIQLATPALPAGSAETLEMVALPSLQYSQHQKQEEQQQQAELATAAGDVGSISAYASAESWAGASTPVAAACSSMLEQQQITRRTFTNMAAPATPILRDVLRSGSYHVQDAATERSDQTATVASSRGSSSGGQVSSSSGSRRFEFSPVIVDGLLQPADTAGSQASLDMQQQQPVLLPQATGASTCGIADAALIQQQLLLLQGGRHRVPQQHGSSHHSCSTHASSTPAFCSACSVWSSTD